MVYPYSAIIYSDIKQGNVQHYIMICKIETSAISEGDSGKKIVEVGYLVLVTGNQ